MQEYEGYVFIGVLASALIAVLAGICAVVWAVLRSAEDRWRPGNLRWTVAGISIVTIAWGLFTSMVLAPAGGLGWLVLHEQSWIWNAIGVIAIDGLFLGICAIVAALLVLRRTTRFASGVAIWSLVHHAAVLALLAALPRANEWIIAIVMAAIGLAISIAQLLAAYLASPYSSFERGVYSTPTPSATP